MVGRCSDVPWTGVKALLWHAAAVRRSVWLLTAAVAVLVAVGAQGAEQTTVSIDPAERKVPVGKPGVQFTASCTCQNHNIGFDQIAGLTDTSVNPSQGPQKTLTGTAVDSPDTYTIIAKCDHTDHATPQTASAALIVYRLTMPAESAVHNMGSTGRMDAQVKPIMDVTFEIKDAQGGQTDKATIDRIERADLQPSNTRTYVIDLKGQKTTFGAGGTNEPVRINGLVQGTVAGYTSITVCGVDPIEKETISQDYQCNNNMVGHKGFDIEFTGSQLNVTIKIKLVGDPAGEQVRANWKQWIKDFWGGWRKLKPNDCVCPGQQKCCEFPVVVDVEWVDDGQHHTVTVHSGMPPQLNEANWGTDCTANDIRHEAAHMLGLFDENPSGGTDPDPEGTPHDVPCSIMYGGDCSTRYARHYRQPYASWLQSKTGRVFILAE